MSLEKVLHAPYVKKQAETNWIEFELSEHEEDETHVHVTDLADGHHGVHAFRIACEVTGVECPSEREDPDAYYMFQDEQMEKWSEEVRDIMGDDGYSVEWFHDGSISIVYDGNIQKAKENDEE